DWSAVSSDRVSRILRVPIRRFRAPLLCRLAGDRRAPAPPRGPPRPAAGGLRAAAFGDDARRQPLVARPAELGGPDLCVGDRAGRRLGIAAGMAPRDWG